MRGFLVLALLIIFASCQEEVTLPLGEKENLVPTIEAYWTDNGIYNEVKFTLSKDYYDAEDVQVITDAEVVITIPGTETVIPFRYVPGTKSYKPNNPLERARVGETYQLNIKWGENIYRSEGVMLEAPTVDSLTWSLYQGVWEDTFYAG